MTIKPHRAVSSSSIARWLKRLLEVAGVDTSIFSAPLNKRCVFIYSFTRGDIYKWYSKDSWLVFRISIWKSLLQIHTRSSIWQSSTQLSTVLCKSLLIQSSMAFGAIHFVYYNQGWVKYIIIIFNYNYKYLKKLQLQIQILLKRAPSGQDPHLRGKVIQSTPFKKKI